MTSFRELMAGFPTGVAVLTTFDVDDTPWGMTISSVCSVSMDPPTLLVCVRNGSPTLDALLRRGSFTVNLLHQAARPAAELFCSGDPDRFSQVTWERPSLGGPHLVFDAHAVADCTVSHIQEVGTHVVVFGSVHDVTHRSAEEPLLYGKRQYAAWPASA
ncbi:flavin reductase family protein [Lentzea sp. NPDC051838]|uniref:flavin reductase family protein n=1 Tax=Lentzea sp. NPDC051838 TaxID=3154849 RepID=UPI003434A916